MEIVGLTRSNVGESPFWSPIDGRIYWSDLRGQAVLSRQLAGGLERRVEFDRPVAAPLPLIDGGFAALLSDTLYLPASSGWMPLPGPAEHDAGHRFNDATIDPLGRLIAGTMVERGHPSAPTGILYVRDAGGWRTLLRGFWTINGLAFTPDGRTLYLSDSHPSVSTIWCIDYDPAHGVVSGERRILARLDPTGGRPDGAAMDSMGGYWIAAVGGGRLLRLTPDGRLDREMLCATRFPTKLAFAGPDLRTIFVTTLIDPSGAIRERDEGALFQTTAPITGSPVPALTRGAAFGS